MATEETTSVKIKRSILPALMGGLLGFMILGLLVGFLLTASGKSNQIPNVKLGIIGALLGAFWGFYMGYNNKF